MSSATQVLKDNLTQARAAVAEGALDRAMSLYGAVFETNPDQLEALHFLGMTFVDRGLHERGQTLLLRASSLAPGEPRILISLALSYQVCGDVDNAIRYLEEASSCTPRFPPALLQLGLLREKNGEPFDALRAYVVAIAEAQKQGQWRSPESTPAHLHDRVGHAMRFIGGFAPRYYSEILASLQSRFGKESLIRVERCVAQQLKQIENAATDSRQNPKFLHFPALPTSPYFSRELFPWMKTLESSTEAIANEFISVCGSGSGLQPFLSLSADASVDDYLGGEKGVAGWGAHFFYRHGKRFDEHFAGSPVTGAAIEALPLVRIEGAAPEVLFSVLSGGAEIKPHRGVTNTRSVLHLPLIVPRDCELIVGGEKHCWQKGKAIVFDDTFEHEARNGSQADRVVLIADVWNPYLTEIERLALVELVPAIAKVQSNLRLN